MRRTGRGAGAIVALLVAGGLLGGCVASGVSEEPDEGAAAAAGGRDGTFGRDWSIKPEAPAGEKAAKPTPVPVVTAPPAPVSTPDTAPAPAPTPAETGTGWLWEDPVRITLPDFEDKDLGDVRAALEALGADDIKTVDATGDGRSPWVDSNWKVCSQDPRKGREVDASDRITLAVVKDGERCP
ncbi:PASTA domain-containing protein [Cellulomonas triticagri]|uniref:PASTA domain-containing protein n=1 Tax=Cellulomonas triticagri TaxID=2483352 RepID=A0A3M2JLB1_9CELL|nr:PASTA domain-containing protein [Cellulomonas triticagri]RMI12670.1 PASTA domain-containing protein [Cellulomonas triticagri]